MMSIGTERSIRVALRRAFAGWSRRWRGSYCVAARRLRACRSAWASRCSSRSRCARRCHISHCCRRPRRGRRGHSWLRRQAAPRPSMRAGRRCVGLPERRCSRASSAYRRPRRCAGIPACSAWHRQCRPGAYRDGVRGLSVDFQPKPLPRGLVEFDAPSDSGGNAFGWRTRRTCAGASRKCWILVARVDRVALSDDGRFAPPARPRKAASPRHHCRCGSGAPTPRVLRSRARQAGSEIRRWAMPACRCRRMAVGGGVQMGDAPIAQRDTLKRLTSWCSMNVRGRGWVHRTRCAARSFARRTGRGGARDCSVAGGSPAIAFARSSQAMTDAEQCDWCRSGAMTMRCMRGSPGTRDQSRRADRRSRCLPYRSGH